ncbi:hypothetical protein Htur_0521 [Haloterrigena turkmenica DSM 5511]|uniref:Uncharacterized protein n=1 Tax=Haloterrigena turkmenica (strain ATCC 51198 / DSM 5511 / JCM 9101 / NCIMB 13204 / VKM B-1734 / 4k) TaxID=543526 RepID=D2RVQ5_HALTV|nr:hypothetical protein [Haloterrigena turkmenica]ADB59419.1 hypothetical protein Htur_0521 [Haloterrigena turkmenica DSM 5511]
MRNDNDRSLVSRTIEGVETLVSTESGEIFVDVPAANARYVRVEEGDTIQEGDIRSRSADELASESLRKWRVESIGPETIIGTDRETDERREWDREELEQKLAIGSLSTSLSGFERATVSGTADASNGEPVTVTVYGNDSRKFTQTYRPVDDTDRDERRLELATADERVEAFDDDLRERFDSTVALALRNEGYAV